MPGLQPLINHLEEVTGQSLKNHRLRSINGGDVSSAYRLQTDNLDWFVKLNHAALANMFAAEAAGLLELASSGSVSVPQVICFGAFQSHAYLVLNFIELEPLTNSSGRIFGHNLANLHKKPQAYFGWPIDNTIGSTPQRNDKTDSWIRFWKEHRLGKQLQLAARNGHIGLLQSQGERLSENLGEFFRTYQPHPSLLHGDLWGGNVGTNSRGQPVMFDPACYYGDREADVAMTELFGGFNKDFYSAYHAEYPLDNDYDTRKTLYNLYHILNHLNLFGSGYLNQSLSMIERLLSELK